MFAGLLYVVAINHWMPCAGTCSTPRSSWWQLEPLNLHGLCINYGAITSLDHMPSACGTRPIVCLFLCGKPTLRTPSAGWGGPRTHNALSCQATEDSSFFICSVVAVNEEGGNSLAFWRRDPACLRVLFPGGRQASRAFWHITCNLLSWHQFRAWVTGFLEELSDSPAPGKDHWAGQKEVVISNPENISHHIPTSFLLSLLLSLQSCSGTQCAGRKRNRKLMCEQMQMYTCGGRDPCGGRPDLREREQGQLCYLKLSHSAPAIFNPASSFLDIMLLTVRRWNSSLSFTGWHQGRMIELGRSHIWHRVSFLSTVTATKGVARTILCGTDVFHYKPRTTWPDKRMASTENAETIIPKRAIHSGVLFDTDSKNPGTRAPIKYEGCSSPGQCQGTPASLSNQITAVLKDKPNTRCIFWRKFHSSSWVVAEG